MLLKPLTSSDEPPGVSLKLPDRLAAGVEKKLAVFDFVWVGGGEGSSIKSLHSESKCLLMLVSLTGLSQIGQCTIGSDRGMEMLLVSSGRDQVKQAMFVITEPTRELGDATGPLFPRLKTRQVCDVAGDHLGGQQRYTGFNVMLSIVLCKKARPTVL